MSQECKLVRQAWYEDYIEQVLEPGNYYAIKLSMPKNTRTPTSGATGELKISAPTWAAVFLDDQFAGHVNEFDGVAKECSLHQDSIACGSLYPVTYRPECREQLTQCAFRGAAPPRSSEPLKIIE